MIVQLNFLTMLGITALLAIYPLQGHSSGKVERESIAKIKTEIENFLTNQIRYDENTRVEISTGRINQRIKVQKCDKPIKYSLRGNQRFNSRINVKAECLTPDVDWKLTLPVDIRIFKSIVTATKPIYKNELFSAENVNIVEQEITNLSDSYYERVEQVLGKLAKRPIRQGQAINLANLEMPKLVRRGEIVQITARKKGLEVNMQGAAISDGTSGSRIPVQNLKTKKIVEGYVKGPGQVEIIM